VADAPGAATLRDVLGASRRTLRSATLAVALRWVRPDPLFDGLQSVLVRGVILNLFYSSQVDDRALSPRRAWRGSVLMLFLQSGAH
jgi:hypothetical protein